MGLIYEAPETGAILRLDYKKRRTQILEFIDSFRVGCSSIGKIMTERRGKTKAEKLEELKESIATWKTKADAIKDGLKSKQNALDKVAQLENDFKQLQDYEETASEQLSETAKSYCRQKLADYIFEKPKAELKTQPILKGQLVEAEGIELIGEYYEDLPFCFKHEGSKQNAFIRGECDILISDRVIDHKASVDHQSFPLFESEIPDEQYTWQVQGYMWLYERENASVIYTLLDMPEQLINERARYELGWNYNHAQYEQFRQKFLYSHLPIEDRIRRWDFQKEQARIDAIPQKVELCKKYILEIAQNRGWV